MIHVKKYQIYELFTHVKFYSIPVNSEEAYHTPRLEELADFIIEWQDTSPIAPENSHFSKASVEELFRLIIETIGETKKPSKSQKLQKSIENLKKI